MLTNLIAKIFIKIIKKMYVTISTPELIKGLFILQIFFIKTDFVKLSEIMENVILMTRKRRNIDDDDKN